MFRKSLYKSILITLVTFILSACTMQLGMGISVDTEAPVVTVTSPTAYAKVHSDISFTGTCSDNVKVKTLTISEQSTGQVYGTINNPAAEWTFKPSKPLEKGYHTLFFTVDDAAGNEGSSSRRAISFTVDDDAPEGKIFQIRRPNYKYADFALTKEELTKDNLKYTYLSMDLFQNGEFSVVSEFQDDIGVSKIEFSVYDAGKNYSSAEKNNLNESELDNGDLENPLFVITVSSDPDSPDFIGTENSINSPVVKITKDDLISKNNKFETESRIIYITCISYDEHGNVNEEPYKLGYVLWDPDSDKPQFQPKSFTLDEENNLKVSASTAITFDIFDDDGINEIYYKFFNEDETPIEPLELKDNWIKSNSSIDYGSNTVNGVVHVTPGNYTSPASYTKQTLVWLVIDKNGVENSGTITVVIDDKKIPSLTIESPLKNTVPDTTVTVSNNNEITSAKFTVSGYGVDTNSVVSIKVAYVPEGTTVDKDVLKKNFAFVNDVTFGEENTKFIKIGNVYYTSFSKTPLKKSGTANGGNKYDFKFDFDMAKDKAYEALITNNEFSIDTTKESVRVFSSYTSNKTFVFEVKDNDNNCVYETVTYNPDKVGPLITVNSPKNGDTKDYFSDLNIICKIEKEKVPVITQKIILSAGTEYSDFTKCDENGTPSERGAYKKITIPASKLKELYDSEKKNPEFEIIAVDAFGNESKSKVYISLVGVPQLNEISSPDINKKYKAGDVITLEAKFSSSVSFNQKPKLRVEYEVNSVGRREELETITSTNNDVLQFKFTVPDNATGKLQSVELAGEIYSATNTNAKAVINGEGIKQLQDTKDIYLDGVKPLVSKIELSTTDGVPYEGKRYLTVGKTKDNVILATVTFDSEITSIVPALKLKWGGKDVDFNVKTIYSSNKKIIFDYTVSRTTPELTTSDSIEFVSFGGSDITDISGNNYDKALQTTAVKPVNDSVIIDLTSPSAAPVHNLTQDSYTEAKILEIPQITSSGTKNYEDGAKVEFVLEDGQDWIEYSKATAEQKTLKKGYTYNVRTRQTDIAGNVSEPSAAKSISILGFPEMQSFAMITPDGINTASKIQFKMSFAREVNVSANSATIYFSSIQECKNAEGNVISAVNMQAKNKGTTKSREVEFESAVLSDEIIFQGLKVEKVVFTSDFKDSLGNVPTSLEVNNDANDSLFKKRTDFYYDKVAPAVNSKTQNISGNNTFTIELNFSEEVTPEFGEIKIERNGNWYIPAVLTVNEFNKYYNACDSDKKVYLLETESVNGELLDKKDSMTGISVGPYKKITHGLKYTTDTNGNITNNLATDSSGYVYPDIDTKYVLDFNIALKPTDNVGDKAKLIQTALASANYHKHSVDVTNSSYVKPEKVGTAENKKKYLITFPDEIAEGIEWNVYIPAGAFVDSCGNKSAAIGISEATAANKTGQYVLWSRGVSTPVVRVDRYSHGYGAHEYSSSGEETFINGVDNPNKKTTPSDSTDTTKYGGTTKPSGYVRVRMDSQTPDAVIRYKQTSSTSTNSVDGYKTTSRSHTDVAVAGKKTADISKTTFTGDSEYSDILYIGAEDIYKPRKDYFAAMAQKTHTFNGTSDTQTSSQTGYEGAFRTVVVVDQGTHNNRTNQLNVDGGTAKGGRPSYSGFPLRDGWSEQYSKNMFYDVSVTVSNNNKAWIWCSYEILIEDCCLLLRFDGRNTKNYPSVDYGAGAFIYKYDYY